LKDAHEASITKIQSPGGLATSTTEAGFVLTASGGVQVGGVEVSKTTEAHEVADPPGFAVVTIPDPDNGSLRPGVNRGEMLGVACDQRGSQLRPGAWVTPRRTADRTPEAVQAHPLVSEDLQLLL
jgi:hypothetical protein